MRTLHTLWRVSNGWLLVPEDTSGYLHSREANQCAVFKTLKEFSEAYPKRERKKTKPKPTTKETTNANLT